MKAFTLRSDPDRPWLEVRDEEWSVLQDLSQAAGSARGRWKPLRVHRVTGEDDQVIGGIPGGPLTDSPTLGGVAPCFSRRATEALRELLEPSGELLPLVCDEGEFFVYHITRRVPALDERNSQVARLPNGRIALVHRYELLPELMANLAVFRLTPEQGGVALVTEPFVDRVKAAGLSGFLCEEVWPSPARPARRPPVQGRGHPQVSERALSASEHGEIDRAAQGAFDLLSLRGAQLSPADIVAHIDRFLTKHEAPQDPDGLAISLGSLWGEQLRRERDWEWVFLVARAKRKAVGEGFALVPSDRSLAVLPMVSVRKQLQRPPGQRSMSLLFQMLTSGRGFDSRGPRSYTIVG